MQMGKTNLTEFTWTREPEIWKRTEEGLTITTAPHTDLWQRTYYHFRNDSAPCLQIETDEQYFSFYVCTEFGDAHHRFDQCGPIMYLDTENWLKASVEYENGEISYLGSVVTNEGYSDWATMSVPADLHTMWYRVSRREDDYQIACSPDGRDWQPIRMCHMRRGDNRIRIGVYACSPEDSSFTAHFSHMEFAPCAWEAHDGQPPDEE